MTESARQQILEESRRQSNDLADILTCLDRIEHKLDRADQKLASLGQRVDLLGRAIGDLRYGLPGIIRTVMRDVLREHDAPA